MSSTARIIAQLDEEAWHKPSASVVMVTPEIARRWLDHNTGNRTMKPREIDRYARDMADGNWRITGEAIKFAKSGRLLDGQNRLQAVIKSGTTVAMFVVRGLDDDSQRVMDSGVKRTSADDLQMHGEKNPAVLAAVIRFAIGAERVGAAKARGYSTSNPEVATFLKNHPEIREAAKIGLYVSRQIDSVPTVVGYSYWKLSQIDALDAHEFFHDAASRVGLDAGDPVLALTKRFAEARRNRERIPHAAQLSAIYRTWNARRDGKAMAFVRIKSPKSGDVPIPEPK